MNAKRCKALRRAARAESVGMPARRLVWGSVILNPRKAKAHKGSKLKEGRLVNDPRTTRGIYRAMKRMAA